MNKKQSESESETVGEKEDEEHNLKKNLFEPVTNYESTKGVISSRTSR